MDKLQKQQLSIVVIGHVDSGKSTTIGHLIYKMGGVDDEILEKFEKESAEIGKGTFKYAWILNKLKAERERDITIDISLWKLESELRQYTVIDVPGHRDLIRNMIIGASEADAAILIVSAKNDEFEVGLSKRGQTWEHSMLAYTMGVKQMIVVINKMDSIDWDEDKYKILKSEVSDNISRIGYKTNKTDFIPISGYWGDNIIEKSGNMPWYTGPTLIEAMDALRQPKRPFLKPLRLPIQDVYKIGGIGTVAVGRIETGVLKLGTKLTFAPKGLKDECEAIEVHNESIAEATAGNIVKLTVKDLSVKEIKRGFVASDSENDPAMDIESFIAHVTIMNHPGEIVKGYTPIIHVHTAHVAWKFEELLTKADRWSGRKTDECPKYFKTGDSGTVKLVPTKPIWVDSFHRYPPLGRFCFRDMRQTVGVGVIMEVTNKE